MILKCVSNSPHPRRPLAIIAPIFSSGGRASHSGVKSSLPIVTILQEGADCCGELHHAIKAPALICVLIWVFRCAGLAGCRFLDCGDAVGSEWAKLSESSYAISTGNTVDEVHSYLKPVLDSNDNIYIITLKKPYTGFGPKDVNDWLESNLTY